MTTLSRNKREGYYAGYYPRHPHFGKGWHRRWTAFEMSEFYPRIDGVDRIFKFEPEEVK